MLGRAGQPQYDTFGGRWSFSVCLPSRMNSNFFWHVFLPFVGILLMFSYQVLQEEKLELAGTCAHSCQGER
jgi:hypothetical protein